MKKAKVSDLSGTALDWAVAKCEGIATTPHLNPFGFWVLPDLPGSFSKEWAYGGPIIERESIQLTPNEDMESWSTGLMFRQGTEDYQGSTPLVAAMRCYVASKLGNEIEVPDEL